MSQNLTAVEVSVVCMTFNQRGYIEQCLESLVSQKTDFRYEIIVHDDASQDGTSDYVREFASKNNNVIAICQTENQFSKGANIRELIMPYVSGKYIALCEGDDWWLDEDKLQVQFEYMESHKESSACAHEVECFSEETGKFERRVTLFNAVKDYTTEEIIESKAPFGTNSLFFRSELYLMPECYCGWGVGDYPLCVWLSTQGFFHYEPKVMSAYRTHAKNSWSERMISNKSYALEANERIINGLKNLDECTSQKYTKSILNAIDDYAITNCVINRNFSEICRGKYAETFSKYSAKQKAVIFLKCYFPRLSFFLSTYCNLH